MHAGLLLRRTILSVLMLCRSCVNSYKATKDTSNKCAAAVLQKYAKVLRNICLVDGGWSCESDAPRVYGIVVNLGSTRRLTTIECT